jgi:ATP-dependent DNA ligase
MWAWLGSKQRPLAFDCQRRRVCRRMLMRDATVPISLVVVDVLELDGEPTMGLPYRRRRELLEELDFYGGCEVGSRFDDGAASWEVVVERRLEGVVAKRLAQSYRPRRTGMGQAEEPGTAALRGRARGSDPGPTEAPVKAEPEGGRSGARRG